LCSANGTDGCEYIDTPREERVISSKSTGPASGAALPNRHHVDVTQDSSARSSARSYVQPVNAESQHHVKLGKSNSRDPVALASEKSHVSVSATKSTTPRDVLNSAAIRGDLFPRQLSGGDSVSNSKRSISHSSSGQTVTKPGFHVMETPVGHVSAPYNIVDSVDSDERASRLDLSARPASSSSVAYSDKRTFR